MRKPERVKMWVGEDGQPRGMIEGVRVGKHRTVHGLFRVIVYAPTNATSVRPKRRTARKG